ncbi:TetR family transcriptional regulator [Streptomyces sodiiphilus]|uniref:TetR family transcriptional regulator n=1 Tax=Streptomyces sodiiphilus TaxID=226217 RepID=A0ABN2PK18_9ACTN
MTATPARVPYAEAARALLRTSLLDAATDLLRVKPWPEVTMADIAKAAGVSRQTLYKEFGSRQSFAQAYILRESDRFLTAVEEALTRHLDEPRHAISAAVEVFLAAAAEEPLIKAIVAGDGDDGLLPYVTNQAGPVLSGATKRLADSLTDSWPSADAEALRLLANYLVRLAISHAASPEGTPRETARDMAEVLGPYLENALNGK